MNKRKKLWITLLILLFAIFLIFLLLLKTWNAKSGSFLKVGPSYFPKSTLADSSDTTHELFSAKNYTQMVPVPGTSYIVSFPERDIDVHENNLQMNYNYFNVVVFNDTEKDKDIINDVLPKFDAVQQGIQFTERMNDNGSLNAFITTYHAGYYDLGNNNGIYALIYELTTDEEDPLYFYVSCKELSNLPEAKKVLDNLAYSLKTEKNDGTDENGTGDTESVTPQNGITFTGEPEEDTSNDWYKETDERGESYYKTNHKFDMITSNGDNYVVFQWGYVSNYPMNYYIESPTMKRYYYDQEESSDGIMVFHIPDAVNGTYTINLTTQSSLGNCEVHSYTKDEYFALYHNQDADGNPIRSFE